MTSRAGSGSSPSKAASTELALVVPFLPDDALHGLVVRCSVATGQDALALGIEHAWYLRERDMSSAQGLLAALRPRLADVDPPDERAIASARLALVAATSECLACRFATAQAEALQSAQDFERAGDFRGVSDALFLQSEIAQAQGDHALRDRRLAEAGLRARLAGDALRAALCEATQALHAATQRQAAAMTTWGEAVAQWTRHPDPSLRALAFEFMGHVHAGRADYPGAIEAFLACADLSFACGRVSRGIFATIDAGSMLGNLGDLDGARRWYDSALERARRTGWPRVLGAALLVCASSLLDEGQLPAARRFAEEARDQLSCAPPTIPSAALLHTLGGIARAEGRLEDALSAFRQEESLAQALGSTPYQTEALQAQVEVLCDLERPEEAKRVSESALALARLQGNDGLAYRILEGMATVHARLGSPAPEGSAWPDAVLHHLHEALAAVEGLPALPVPSRLLARLASEHTRAGSHERAAHFSQRAVEATAREQRQRATDRAVAMRFHHDLERRWVDPARGDPPPRDPARAGRPSRWESG